jgi:hypothetical protein
VKIAERVKPNLNMRVPIELVGIRLDMLRGDWGAARRHIDAVLALADYPASKQTGMVRAVLALAAEAALHAGQPLEAERRARQALEMAQAMSRGENTSGDVGEALLILAKARAAQAGAPPEKSLLQRAVLCLTNGYGPESALAREAQSLLVS